MVDTIDTFAAEDVNALSTVGNSDVDDIAISYIRMQKRLKSQSYNFDVLYEELAEYMLPHKVGFITTRSKGQKQTQRIFDSTAITASATLASTLHGALTSSAVRWFGLRTRDPEMMKDKKIKVWIDQVVTRMIQHINDSNFDSEVDEGYVDIVIFGMMALWHSDVLGKSQYEAIHLSNVWFVEDSGANPETVLTLKKINCREAVKRWGKTGKLHDKYSNSLQTNPSKEYEFLHVVDKRYDKKPLPTGKKAPASERPYAEYWIDMASKQVLEEGGFYEFPVYIPRWAKTVGEARGRSVGMNALPDVKTLNKAKELGLKAWAKVLDPPLKRRNAGVVTRVKSVPGGITDMRNMEDLKPLYDSNAFRFDVSQIKQQELKQSINETFYIDQLRLPPMQESKTMSATEAQIRYEQMEKIIAPTLGRIKKGLLAPNIRRVFAMLMRNGELPDIPDGLSEIDIEYVSPFETAQKMAEVANVQRFIADVMGIAQATPEALDRLNPDGLVDVLHERYSISPNILRSKDEANAVRQQRQQQEQQDRAMMQAQQISEMGKGMPQ